MKTLANIKDTLSKNKATLVQKYPIESIAIFGSFARNEQREDSDVDLLVELKEPIGIEFVDLAEDIEKMLNIKVDLVSKNGMKLSYYNYIKNELIYV